MADGLRHDDFSLLRYDPTEYKVRETVRAGNRRGLVLERSRGRGRGTHTVLLGKTFVGDDPSQRSRGLSASESLTLASSLSDLFLLNDRGKADASADPGSMDDDNSEMYGHVPVACTCEDWKWRGVNHNMSRGPVGSVVAKNNRLDRFYRRYCSKSVTKHYNTSSDLAASQSGCRHMVWVSRTWRYRAGKVPRARRAPARYR